MMAQIALAIGQIIPWPVLVLGGAFVGLVSAVFYRREKTTCLGYFITFACAAAMLLGLWLQFHE